MNVNISEQERRELLQVARGAVEHGVEHRCKMALNIEEYGERLRQEGAVFVTLRKKGELRGCLGSIFAYQPLVCDVADKAYCAAFQDPRFPPVAKRELADILLQISLLTPLQELSFRCEDEGLGQIRPGIDGLVIEAGLQKGTFLPSMWEQLPKTIDFWNHLKLKAGLPLHFWSDDTRVYRFETECFADAGYFAEPLG